VRRTIALTLTAVLASVPSGVRASAASDAERAATCPIDISAVRAKGSDAVIVTLGKGSNPPDGDVTAYSRDRAWSGKLVHSVTRTISADRTASSFAVRTGAPLEGIAYAAGPGCVLHAIVHPPYDDHPDAADPNTINTLTHEENLGPLTCSHPFAEASVTYAAEPTTPAAAVNLGTYGTVEVLVKIDERGVPQSVRTVRSPSATLKLSAENAARLSTYAPRIFRCTPEAGSYIFIVDYTPRGPA
jgi:hypothetical protein